MEQKKTGLQTTPTKTSKNQRKSSVQTKDESTKSKKQHNFQDETKTVKTSVATQMKTTTTKAKKLQETAKSTTKMIQKKQAKHQTPTRPSATSSLTKTKSPKKITSMPRSRARTRNMSKYGGTDGKDETNQVKTLEDLPLVAIENIIDKLGIPGLSKLVMTQKGPFDQRVSIPMDDEFRKEYLVFLKFCHERQFPFRTDNTNPLTTYESIALFKDVKDSLKTDWYNIEENYLYVPSCDIHILQYRDIQWTNSNNYNNLPRELFNAPINAKKGDVLVVIPDGPNYNTMYKLYVYDGTKHLLLDSRPEDMSGIIPALFNSPTEFPIHYWTKRFNFTLDYGDDGHVGQVGQVGSALTYLKFDHAQLKRIEEFYDSSLRRTGTDEYIDIKHMGRTFRFVNNDMTNLNQMRIEKIVTCQIESHQDLSLDAHDPTCSLAIKVFRRLPRIIGHYDFDLVPLNPLTEDFYNNEKIQYLKRVSGRSVPGAPDSVPLENIILINNYFVDESETEGWFLH